MLILIKHVSEKQHYSQKSVNPKAQTVNVTSINLQNSVNITLISLTYVNLSSLVT